MTSSLIQPIQKSVPVAPSDTSNLTTQARGLYIGGAGTVSLLSAGGTTDNYVGLTVGIWHPIQFQRVNSTGTTATSILAGY